MANAELGNVVTVYVEGPSSTALAVASNTSFEVNYTMNAVDTSAKGDIVRTNMAGSVTGTCTLESLYVHSDDAQARLLTLMRTGAQVTLLVYRSGSLYQTITAVITDLTITHTYDEAAMMSASFQFDGDPTDA